jgi:hypothetical protein
MWIDVPLDNGQKDWGMEPGYIFIPTVGLEALSDSDLALCIRALAATAQTLFPYWGSSSLEAIKTIDDIPVFLQKIKEMVHDKEQRKIRTKRLRSEIIANYDTFFMLLSRRDGTYCQYCQSTDNLQIDHVIAIANGGDNALDNLQLLCRPCNSKKHDKQ